MKKRELQRNKKAQMKLSFGMIFSIILIIVFVAFAFYAIQKFVGFQKQITIETFAEDLQEDIDTVWKSSQASQEKEYSLPKKIEEVCFTNKDDFQNMYFESSEYVAGKKIEHLNIEKIVEDKDPFCIKTINGKVKMIIKKDFGESLVSIEKN